LEEQREWLRVTLSSIGDAVITTDTDGLVTFLNPVAESLTGWTQAEAAGVPLETVFKIVNEETRRTVENPATRALREGVVVGLANHTLLIAKDGTERPIDDSAAPIQNAGAGNVGVVLVFRDVTERKQQERLVKDALAYAQNIIATLREPFIVLTKDLRVKTANRSFYETFHVSREETENKFIYDLGNRQWDIPRLRALLKEVLSNNHPIHDYEVEHDFPSIGRKVMRLNALRIREPGDHAESILLAIEDITKRRMARYAVEVSEVRYRRLFETAQDAILILDAKTGEIQDANPFIKQMLGYSLDELVGKELWQIGFFRDKSESQAAFRELQEKGYIRYDHLPLETKEGQGIEVEFVSNAYQVDHRVVIQCNIRDITDRSRLERETQEQAHALADLNRRKDEFLAMLSHELRNPLAPILNAVQFLIETHEDQNPLRQQARAIIQRQAGQLARLVDDLLEVSRVTTGRIQLHLERLDLRGIVKNAVESVRSLIDRQRHELSESLSPQPIWVYADAARLEQVVVNLLNNAAKYTNEGGDIWLSVEQEGDEAVLRVRDTGIGIAPELLPRIFDLFAQADRSLDRSYGGLGIGLTLVRRLVEMHRGRVDAHSAGLGRGSEFTIHLPVLLSPAKPSQSPLIQAAKEPDQVWRVLVVDDNVDSADSTAMLLRMSGHEVSVAYSAESALETAVEHQPNLILLDIGLPEMDGYQVARRLRDAPQLKDVRIIALTGYGQYSDRQRSHEAGFDYHLVKPVRHEELEEVLSMLGKP
jgi:PAS domain S-box-containing protein